MTIDYTSLHYLMHVSDYFKYPTLSRSLLIHD